jgi:hypothetical protein
MNLMGNNRRKKERGKKLKEKKIGDILKRYKRKYVKNVLKVVKSDKLM